MPIDIGRRGGVPVTVQEWLAGEEEGRRAQLQEQFANLAPGTEIRLLDLNSGEVLMRQGDSWWEVCTLIEGRVQVATHQPNYTTYTLREFSPFVRFGHWEALGKSPFLAATVRAKSTCRFCALSREAYLRWLTDSPQVLMKEASEAVSALLYQGLLDRNTLVMESESRVAFYLVSCFQAEGHKGGTGVVIRRSHQEIAEATSLSVRTVTRILHRLRERGLAGSKKGKVALAPSQAEALRELFPPF
nr:Crp/Fnr family transcriptional regulator [Bittarella massiliensis (ex Durand et al. 2017)]